MGLIGSARDILAPSRSLFTFHIRLALASSLSWHHQPTRHSLHHNTHEAGQLACASHVKSIVTFYRAGLLTPMRQAATLLDLADSGSDDARVSVKRTTAQMPAAKSAGSRAGANRVTKTASKSTTRRGDAKKAAAIEKELDREALTEKPTNQATKSKRGRKAKTTQEEVEDALATPPGSDELVHKRGGRGRPKKDAVVPDSTRKADEPTVTKRGRKKANTSAPQEDEKSEIPETQMDDVTDIDEADELEDQIEDLPTFSRYSAPPSAQRNSYYNAPPSTSKRPTSSSLYENDPSTRRRLSEMARKYEALELKYKELKNVAVTEAEKTFDRLRKISEEKTQGTYRCANASSSFSNRCLCSIRSTRGKSQKRSCFSKATRQGGRESTKASGSQRDQDSKSSVTDHANDYFVIRSKDGNQSTHHKIECRTRRRSHGDCSSPGSNCKGAGKRYEAQRHSYTRPRQRTSSSRTKR